MAVAIKKKWYKIIAPAIFNEQEVGETYLAHPEKAIGRTSKINLMTLTNDPKKQNINVCFRISGADGEKLKTEIYNYNLIPSSLKRFIRRGRARIDDSFACITSDDKRVIIKPLIITRFKTNHSVISALRIQTRKFLTDLVSKTKFDNLMKDTVSHKVQNQLKAHLKDIYQLKTCEIRSIEYKSRREKEETKVKEEIKKEGKKETRKEQKEKKEEEKPEIKKEKIEEREGSKEKPEEKRE